MRESKYADLLVHRSTFNDEFTVRENCTPTGMQFLNGVGIFNGGYIACSKPFKGVYSVRIKLKDITPAGVQYLIDCRAGGTGYIRFDSATAVSASSGTMYVDGIAGSTISASTKEITVTGITLDTFLTYYGTIYTLVGNYLAGGMELLEVYKGTLTAAQVSLIYTNSDRLPDDQRHIKRVLNDGGSVRTISNVTSFERMCKRNGIWNNIKFAWTGETGGKTVVNGIYQNFSNIYSVKGATDATQATSGNRPYLTGNIAPNERYGMSNPNGSSRYVTHPTITYTATDPWSLTFMFNNNGKASVTTYDERIFSSGTNIISLTRSGDNRLTIYNQQSPFAYSTPSGSLNKTIGKTSLFTVVYNGTTYECYLNGIILSALTSTSSFSFETAISIGTLGACGKMYNYIIRSGALTAAQVLAEATFFRSIYPEIPTVLIGTQEWATSFLDVVCNGAGTVIPDGTVTGTWITGTSFWCYHSGGIGMTGKLYNKAAREVIKASPPEGYHVSTKAELTAISILGGNALKVSGNTWWSSVGGTNTSGLSLTGASYRNADGSFGTYLNTAKIWCADADEVLTINYNDDTAVISAAPSVNDGYSILLVKN